MLQYTRLPLCLVASWIKQASLWRTLCPGWSYSSAVTFSAADIPSCQRWLPMEDLWERHGPPSMVRGPHLKSFLGWLRCLSWRSKRKCGFPAKPRNPGWTRTGRQEWQAFGRSQEWFSRPGVLRHGRDNPFILGNILYRPFNVYSQAFWARLLAPRSLVI